MKITKYEYEELVRDTERFEILSELRRRKIPINDEILDVICGWQSEDASKDKPVEPVAVDESKKAADKLYEDFLDENYELRKETPSEWTPEEHPTGLADNGPKRRKRLDQDRVMALYNAGWSVMKIADEVRCSVQKVCQIVKEEEDKNAE